MCRPTSNLNHVHLMCCTSVKLCLQLATVFPTLVWLWDCSKPRNPGTGNRDLTDQMWHQMYIVHMNVSLCRNTWKTPLPHIFKEQESFVYSYISLSLQFPPEDGGKVTTRGQPSALILICRQQEMPETLGTKQQQEEGNNPDLRHWVCSFNID